MLTKTKLKVLNWRAGLNVFMEPVRNRIDQHKKLRMYKFRFRLTDARAVKYIVDELIRVMVRDGRDSFVLVLGNEHRYRETEFDEALMAEGVYPIGILKGVSDNYKYVGSVNHFKWKYELYDCVLKYLSEYRGMKVEECREEMSVREDLAVVSKAFRVSLVRK